MRVLVIGAGAVGTVLAAHLVQAGHKVKLAIRPEDVPAMDMVRHLRVDRVTGGPPLTVDKPTLTVGIDLEGIDAAFICVKHPDLQTVLDAFGDHPPANCAVLPCQNGVGAVQRIRQRFPDTESVGVTIMFNAHSLQPLHARVTTEPTVLMQTANAELLSLFDGSGLKVRKARGEGAAWAKLLINLANALCALTHSTFHDVLYDPDLKHCFLMILDEAVVVLNRTQAQFKLPASLPYPVYRLLLQHAAPLALRASAFHHTASPHAYPSMVADMQGGRPTEIDQLNGEVCRLGQLCGVSTPGNQRLVDMIHALEGQKPMRYITPAELRQTLTTHD